MNILNKYFIIWSLFIPMTSVLIIPSVQGSLPGYVFAFVSLFIILVLQKSINKDFKRYYNEIFLIVIVFILLNSLSQLFLAFSNIISFNGVQLVNPLDSKILLKSTFFTQSLYFFACILTFVFVKNFYVLNWDKWILIGAIILASYGIYEFIYFLLFHSNGDFLSNRTFGDGKYSGSLFETLNIGSIIIVRLKSLTGEPSMYAYTILPFWVYSIHLKKKITSIFLFVTLILTASTTAILGLFVYLLIRFRYFGIKDKLLLFFSFLVLVIVLTNYHLIYEMYNLIVLQKVTLENYSGSTRFNMFSDNINFFETLPIFNQIFGIGFGYIRSTDMFSTLLINNGVIGLIIFSYLVLYPVFKLKNLNYRTIGLKAALIIIYVTLMVSVPEYSYLSLWLFLGIAYNELKQKNKLM